MSLPHSGAHLLIDMFGIEEGTGGFFSTSSLMEKVKNGPGKIIINHLPKKYLYQESINYIFNQTIPIVLLRDPRDLLASLKIRNSHYINDFYSYCRNNNYDDFIFDVIKYFYNDFIKPYFLVLRYENILRHYREESKKIEDYIGMKISPTLPPLNFKYKSTRKGVIGDYKNIFNQDEIEYIEYYLGDYIDYIDRYLY